MSKFDTILSKISEALPVLTPQQQNASNNQPVAPDPKKIAELIKATFGVDLDQNALAKILPQQQAQQPNKPPVAGQSNQQKTTGTQQQTNQAV